MPIPENTQSRSVCTIGNLLHFLPNGWLTRPSLVIMCMCVYILARALRCDHGCHRCRSHWLEQFLAAPFFQVCECHPNKKKNELNFFNLNTRRAMCAHCVEVTEREQQREASASKSIRDIILQIRRYVYHNVVRLQDMSMYLDLSLVQTYVINNARVVFISTRQQSMDKAPAPPGPHTCLGCPRVLQPTYKYCSIECKAFHKTSIGEWDFDIKFGPRQAKPSTLAPRDTTRLRLAKNKERREMTEEEKEREGERRKAFKKAKKEALEFGRTGRCHERKGTPHRAAS